MERQQSTGRDEQFVRRYDYDDGWVVAAELGVPDDRVDVDVVGTTAIVVVDAGDGEAEHEFGLPGTAENVDTNNGVLVITGDQ
ncbi:MAG: Hsp20/alpha crystallin family protein [Haloferacaceae archaeon]